MENLSAWEEIMNNRAIVEACIFIDCGEQELERRIISRGLTSGIKSTRYICIPSKLDVITSAKLNY